MPSLGPCFIPHRGFRRVRQWEKRPKVAAFGRDYIFAVFACGYGSGCIGRPGRTGFDPGFESSHFRSLELAAIRHFQIRIRLPDSDDEQTLVWIAWYQSRTTLSALFQRFQTVETQIPQVRVGVTAETIIG